MHFLYISIYLYIYIKTLIVRVRGLLKSLVLNILILMLPIANTDNYHNDNSSKLTNNWTSGILTLVISLFISHIISFV